MPKVAKTVIPGRRKSMTAISFEKRASTLPTGFESKKSILDLATLLRILSCKTFELVRIILKIVRARRKVITI